MKHFIATALFVTTCLMGSNSSAQKNYNSSFIEIGFGQRTYSNLPDNIFVQDFFETNNTLSDTVIFNNLDLGSPNAFILNFGAVVQPEYKGLAGKFSIDGHFGEEIGLGFEAGIGYKIGNPRFGFTPMVSFGLTGLRRTIDTYSLGNSAIIGDNLNLNSEQIFIGEDAELHGVSGSTVDYRMNYAIFDTKVGAYVSYNLFKGVVLFARLAYNFNIGTDKAKFEIRGTGYNNFEEFLDGAITDAEGNSGTAPYAITTEIEEVMMYQDNERIEKMPINFSGVQFSFGIGITDPKN